MRNSTTFWEKTARIGELCWWRERGSGYRHHIGLVIGIDNYSYWSPHTYQEWIYHILVDGEVIKTPSYYVEKLVEAGED